MNELSTILLEYFLSMVLAFITIFMRKCLIISLILQELKEKPFNMENALDDCLKSFIHMIALFAFDNESDLSINNPTKEPSRNNIVTILISHSAIRFF